MRTGPGEVKRRGIAVRTIVCPRPAAAVSVAVLSYLDRGAGRFAVRASGRAFEQAVGTSGRWKTAAFEIDPAAFADDGAGAHITLDTEADLTLHMIEVARNR
jgi:hypothetical protein